MPGTYVAKDLVPDLANVYYLYKSTEPWLKRKGTQRKGDKEYFQSKEDPAKLVGMCECTLCACGMAPCPP